MSEVTAKSIVDSLDDEFFRRDTRAILENAVSVLLNTNDPRLVESAVNSIYGAVKSEYGE